MAEELLLRDLDDGDRRAVSKAAAIAEEQLRYATGIARRLAPGGGQPDPQLIASLVAAIATNFAAVK